MTELTSQDMTVQQAFEIHTKGKSDTLRDKFQRSLNNLEAAGYPPDSTLISELNTEKTITELQKFITTKKYKGVVTASGMFGSHLKTLINVGKPLEVGNVVTAFEANNKGKPTRFGIDKTRGSTDLILPAFDDFMLAIDDTARQIPNKEHRAFFLIKTLTGLRNADIINLQVGRGKEATSLYGSFDPQDAKLFGLSNKGNRINYDVGEVVQGILADLAADAEAEGRTALFSDMEGVDFEDINDVDKRSKIALDKFRSGINPVMNRAMKARGIEIYDKKKGAVKAFSVKDLRSNIFTMLSDELGGPDQANQVLGHSKNGDVGLEYYKQERAKSKSQRRAALSGLQRTQEIFTSLFFEVINQSNPSVLFGPDGYGFDAAKFPNKTIVDVDVDIPPEQQQVENRVKTTAAKATGAAEESVGTLEKTLDKLQGLLSKTQELTDEAGSISAPTGKQKAAEAAANKGRSYLSKFLGKGGGGFGSGSTGAMLATVALGTAGSVLFSTLAKASPGLTVMAPAMTPSDELLPADLPQTAGDLFSMPREEQSLDTAYPADYAPGTPAQIGETAFRTAESMFSPATLLPAATEGRGGQRRGFSFADIPQYIRENVGQDSGTFAFDSETTPTPTRSFLEAEGAKGRVNQARTAASQGEEISMAESFLYGYGGIVR